MEKLEFWNKVNKAWVSNSDGFSNIFKKKADKGTGMTSEEIKKEMEEMKKLESFDFSDF